MKATRLRGPREGDVNWNAAYQSPCLSAASNAALGLDEIEEFRQPERLPDALGYFPAGGL
jgi:hypothetical protein